MAKLELPVQAYIEDFLRRRFPNRDWSRGSAIRDLVIYPMSALLQPLRHEIDAIKVNQSVTNWPYMNRADLDALAANWSKYRQTGGRSLGTVRIYFDQVNDYEFNYLEFFSTDGATFVLQAPVSISARELLAHRRSDNTYYYDVAVQSTGIGNRYALAAGSIAGLNSGPPQIIRVENLEDFEVTAPDETNFDVVNGMHRNLSLKNLVSRSSIRAPILETFPGVLDIYIAGSDHANMVRDLTQVTIDGRLVDLHLGGMVDIWVNTNGLVTRDVTLSYLPSSKSFSIVSADQAQENSLLYTFSQLYLTVDGEYSAAEPDSPSLDESAGIVLDQDGIPTEGYILDVERNGRYVVSARDLVSGQEMISLPVPNNGSTDEIILGDITGINLHNTSAEVGDILNIGSGYYRIEKKSGRVLSVTPSQSYRTPVTYDTLNGANVVNAGERFIPVPAAFGVAQVNDRASIPKGPAQGDYRVLAVDGTGVWLGEVLGTISLNHTEDDGSIFHYEVVDAKIPHDLDDNCWVCFDSGVGGYDQSSGVWNRVSAVLRGTSSAELLLEGGPTGGTHVCTMVRGLRGGLDGGELVYFHNPDHEGFARSTTLEFDQTNTLYANALDGDLVIGSDTLAAAGIGLAASVGDLILFEAPGNIPVDLERSTGGDGTKYSVFIEEVIDQDTVKFAPSLSFELGEDLRYAVMRNNTELSQVVANVVAGQSITVNSWPLGLGDGLGMGLGGTIQVLSDSIDAVAVHGQITVFTLHDNTDLENARPGDIAVISGAGALDGNRTIVRVTDTEVLLDGAFGSDTSFSAGTATVTIQGHRIRVISSSTGGNTRTLTFSAPRSAVDISMDSVGYTSVTANMVGLAVRQVVGGVTYSGVLEAYNNTTRTWTIIPNDTGHDVFAVWSQAGEELTLPDVNVSAQPTVIGSLKTVRYFAPEASDIGRYVKQGDYTGILDSYRGAPYYDWLVKPLSEFDLFDSTTALTFIDRGTGEPTTGFGQGTLAEPASAPDVNAGSVVLSLDQTAPYTQGSTLKVYSRFGRGGAFFDGEGRMKIYPDNAINDNILDGIEPGVHIVQMTLGNNLDVYELDEVVENYVGIATGAPFPEVVRIANAPQKRRISISVPITGGSTHITAPGSNFGVWGHAGRILVLEVAGSTFYLTIQGPTANDGIDLIDPIPLTIFPGQTIYAEIVEGYHLPYFFMTESAMKQYRIFRPIDAADVLFSSTKGEHTYSASLNQNFHDPSVNFRSLIGFDDWEQNYKRLQLFIDDGPEASVDPIDIIGIVDDYTILVDHTFTEASSNVHYHVVARNTAVQEDTILQAEVVGADQLRLIDANDGWDFERYHSYRGWQVKVLFFPGTYGTYDDTSDFPTMTVADYDPTTKLLTLDMASDHVEGVSIGTVFDTTAPASPRGFQSDLQRQQVRVYLYALNRASTRGSDGEVVNTYNYYGNDFFSLPIARIQKVELLDIDTLQPVREVAYDLQVDEPGLRYSAQETNRLVISEAGDDVLFRPVRISYVADETVERINQYVNAFDTRVINMNSLAKRMETISVDVELEVRSEKSQADLRNTIASFINNLDSTARLTKDGLIKHLYEQDAVSFIDTDSISLSAVYLRYDGDLIEYEDQSEIFGADTACYLSNNITVLLQVGAR
jgi:hypothetical protein